MSRPALTHKGTGLTCHRKHAIHFGAGNIGRGFIGPLLVRSGYHVIFLDVQQDIIDELNREHHYDVNILDLEADNKQEVRHVTGFHTKDESALEAIAQAEIITTSVGPKILERIAPTIAEGLLKRRDGEFADLDLTVIACENMINATDSLKGHVVAALKARGETDIDGLFRPIGFANCEVDRIIPPYTGGNPLDVGVEGFYEWTVEKSKVRPPTLAVEGMNLQDSLEPFLERKLYTLNCGHAMLAFTGYIKGLKTIDEAVHDEQCRHIAKHAIQESGAALIRKHGFTEEEHREYIDRTMTRYANPNIKDQLERVARNPKSKLAPNERLVGAANMCRQYGLPRKNLMKGIAAAFHFDVDEDEEALQLVKLVKDEGIETAIEKTTEYKKGSKEHSDILQYYHEWKEQTARSFEEGV
ncbi:mannitol-1-phosphate 5-dehydrogenase [Cylindrobasidium torrendii FP15055 ss-10]|uniref:Mannitol-1-phosphate 5-dehydrogenase n=1 Tax=Cylindrobasidium torrendii FP15055 ss-10 TaxID=1314674 RepID=A0A0D7BF19_9AGAR|nr:mannitol-1-phosphate 5-dehydrogenase [Cylindrobasidium torrendii FP15055 ss-10]